MEGPATYSEGTTSVYRASAIGGDCTRALVALRLGYTAVPWPESLQRKADESSLLEEVVLARLQDEHGWVFLATQETVEWEVMPGVLVRGHTDGRGKHPDHGQVIVEVKNLGDSLYDSWTREGIHGPTFTRYAWQISAYMIATGLPGLMAVAHKGGEELSVVFLEHPPVPKAVIVKHLVGVELAVRKGELPSCCDRKMWPCPVPYLHDDEEVEVDEALTVLLSTYRQGDLLEKQGKEMKGEVRDRLLEVIGDRKKVQAGGLEVARSVSVRTNTDYKRLLADHPEIDKSEYETASETVSLRVREVE